MGYLSPLSFAQVLESLLVPCFIYTSTKGIIIGVANHLFLSSLLGSGILADLY